MSKRNEDGGLSKARRSKALKLKKFRVKVADDAKKVRAKALSALISKMRPHHGRELDSASSYVVADSAKWQINSLDRKALQLLASVVGGEAKQSAMLKTTPSGNIVSRLGKDMRVLWREEKGGKPTVLSVVVKSEAAEA